MEEIEGQLFSLLNLIKPYIKDDFKDEIIEFITHCECGLAFEDIVETIIYYKINITAKDYEKFIEAGKTMNLQHSKWEKLKDFVL